MERAARTVALLAVAVTMTAAGETRAAIRCQGPSQVIPGQGLLPTPWCEDAYLAQIARGYGVAVTAAQIRASYNRKIRVCELIGNDTRVASVCAGLRPADRRGRKRIFN